VTTLGGTASWAWLPVFLLVISAPVAMGVALMYHRVLTHRAAVISPWVAYPLVAIAAPAGPPVGWVGNHRRHHQVTDRPEDVHSPARHGFWVAHAGWYLGTDRVLVCAAYTVGGPLRMIFDAFWRPRTGMAHAHLAPDVASVGFYRWLSRPGPYALVVLAHAAITWGLAWWWFGAWSLPILYALQVGYFFVGDGVNSLAHRYGRRPFRSRDASTNLAWLAALTAGEGFHHNHHVFPTSVRAGLLPGQIDVAYLFARGLARVGLAHSLREPTLDQLLDRLVDDDARARLTRRHPSERVGIGGAPTPPMPTRTGGWV